MDIEKLKKYFTDNELLYYAGIELTQHCNFSCKHCYCTGKFSEIMLKENYIHIIDKLYEQGCLFLNFTGGEILTYPDFEEIYVYAKNKGFIVSLLTNGSLIDEHLIELFKKLPPYSIAITLYGTNEQEYELFTGARRNYNKVMRALKLLDDNNIAFILRTVATQTLYDSLILGKFEQIAKKFNTTFRYDPIVFPKTSGDKTPLNECLSVDQIIALEKSNQARLDGWSKEINCTDTYKYACKGGVNSLAIDYQGNAHICGLYRKDSISIIDNDMNTVMKHLRKIHDSHLEIAHNNDCSTCNNRKICKWCPAYSLIYNGTISDKIDFFCQVSAARRYSFS